MMQEPRYPGKRVGLNTDQHFSTRHSLMCIRKTFPQVTCNADGVHERMVTIIM